MLSRFDFNGDGGATCSANCFSIWPRSAWTHSDVSCSLSPCRQNRIHSSDLQPRDGPHTDAAHLQSVHSLSWTHHLESKPHSFFPVLSHCKNRGEHTTPTTEFGNTLHTCGYEQVAHMDGRRVREVVRPCVVQLSFLPRTRQSDPQYTLQTWSVLSTHLDEEPAPLPLLHNVVRLLSQVASFHLPGLVRTADSCSTSRSLTVSPPPDSAASAEGEPSAWSSMNVARSLSLSGVLSDVVLFPN